MGHRLTKERIKEIREVADSLPNMFDTSKKPSKRVLGSQLLKLGGKMAKITVKYSGGEVREVERKLKPKKFYSVEEPMYPLINHMEKLLPMYEEHGMDGVLYYQDLIVKKYSQGLDELDGKK